MSLDLNRFFARSYAEGRVDRMRQLNFSAVFISLVIFLIVSPQSSGQWAKSTGDKNLQHNVTVVLKLIQVYVVDKKGDPVTDLTRKTSSCMMTAFASPWPPLKSMP